MGDITRLYTDRLIIREHLLEDLSSHHALLSNPVVMYYLQDIKTSDIKESNENLMLAINELNNEDRTQYFFRIEKKDSHEHIGEIGYTVLSRTPLGNMVELGYFIHKAYWGKGYVTEAVEEILHFAFTEGNVFRIMTGCNDENKESERIMIKCGMIKEAHHKKCAWHDGRIKGRVEYRLLKDEWLNLIK